MYQLLLSNHLTFSFIDLSQSKTAVTGTDLLNFARQIATGMVKYYFFIILFTKFFGIILIL